MFEHDFPFDPTYGYDDDQLLAVEPPTAPDDFEAFWRERYNTALTIPAQLEREPCPRFTNDRIEVETVRFNAMGLNGQPPLRIGGWLTRPKRETPVRAEVFGHGYGGREAPDGGPGDPPAIRLFVCMRGFHLSAVPGIPGVGRDHVLHGIESRDTYIHLGCAADLWAAVGVLRELHPEFHAVTDYRGGSFGGGIGALAVAWDARIRRVALRLPSFGNHPLRLTLPCTGSGESIRKLHHGGHDVLPVLRYFDAASAARFITQPTLVGCARFDPAVPPPGQVCVFNAIPGDRKELVLRDGGHFNFPGEPGQLREYERRVAAWFAV